MSRAAIHNLYVTADRERALREIARVLKPGGHALIEDIRHLRDYEKMLIERGCAVRQVGSAIQSAVLFVLTFGPLRTGTLVAEKLQ